jgi:hypothetical protein
MVAPSSIVETALKKIHTNITPKMWTKRTNLSGKFYKKKSNRREKT